MADARGRVDAVLERWAAHSERFWPSPVSAAIRYSLLSTGKRLRPTLVVAWYEAVGGGSPAVAELAAAVEVVHAYSLVHDDLPCMDNDDLRRGRPPPPARRCGATAPTWGSRSRSTTTCWTPRPPQISWARRRGGTRPSRNPPS